MGSPAKTVTADDYGLPCPGHCYGSHLGTPEPHTCPYAEEINNDHEPHCHCCKECEQECADDI